MSELKKIEIPDVISVHELAGKLDISSVKLVGELMRNGVMATINESIDFDTASIIAAEFGFELVPAAVVIDERPSQSKSEKSEPSAQSPRSPIVTVMGHVDHGKTSLLDAIRLTNVTSQESGGITQHIGAYQVEKNDRLITFLDTPGHEAFSALRAHGAKMTDIAIIVVAADDGVKPQTKEAIEHARAADVPLIIAINKIDKTGADPNRVKQELSDIEVVADDWGGEVPCVEVSAKTNVGIDKLLEMILLVADIASPMANPNGSASGVIIESHMESGRGPVATMLVQQGQLKLGDNVIAGSTMGKVRSLQSDLGKRIKTAAPATPVVVSGLKSVPDFGDWFEVVESEKVAREWLNRKSRETSIKSLVRPKSITASDLVSAVDAGKLQELPILLKADAQGSLESLTESLSNLGNDEVRVKIISSGVGDISENDVNTASAGGAIILGFHVSIKAAVNQLAKQQSVDFNIYKIIYELIDDVRGWLSSLLAPEIIETEIGRLQVLAVFKQSRDHVITGGVVTSGKVTPDLTVNIMRGTEKLGQGKLSNLQKNKQPAREVVTDEQCGLKLTTDIKLAVDDELVFIAVESRARTI